MNKLLKQLELLTKLFAHLHQFSDFIALLFLSLSLYRLYYNMSNSSIHQSRNQFWQQLQHLNLLNLFLISYVHPILRIPSSVTTNGSRKNKKHSNILPKRTLYISFHCLQWQLIMIGCINLIRMKSH